VQGGTLNEEPYREAGLEGQGQICGIADSGVNDLSCFFLDNSGAYPTVTTNRSGVVEPLRRKIIQYVSHADDLDEEGGHGTHVCGTVAGSSLQEFGHMNGMAPQAKIAFFDIGVTDRDYLKLPATDDIFNAAYTAGARIHTNSWGNLGGLYGQMSFDVDKFVFEHPDFLVVFAAGNSGDLGGKSIISPGNSKNALSVGAGQVRTVLTDELRTPGNENTALAYFSSLGPTTDGRLVGWFLFFRKWPTRRWLTFIINPYPPPLLLTPPPSPRPRPPRNPHGPTRRPPCS
jgi:subtilisin family serine protease